MWVTTIVLYSLFDSLSSLNSLYAHTLLKRKKKKKRKEEETEKEKKKRRRAFSTWRKLDTKIIKKIKRRLKCYANALTIYELEKDRGIEGNKSDEVWKRDHVGASFRFLDERPKKAKGIG